MSKVLGADEFLRDLQKLGAEMPRVEREMLKAGGQTMAEDGWEAEIRARDFISRGENQDHMVDHVVYKVVSRKGRPRAEITAQGTDSRGVRHAAKAFYLHYGTSKIRATHWIDTAEARAMPAASAAMGAALAGALNQTIGGKNT